MQARLASMAKQRMARIPDYYFQGPRKERYYDKNLATTGGGSAYSEHDFIIAAMKGEGPFKDADPRQLEKRLDYIKNQSN